MTFTQSSNSNYFSSAPRQVFHDYIMLQSPGISDNVADVIKVIGISAQSQAFKDTMETFIKQIIQSMNSLDENTLAVKWVEKAQTELNALGLHSLSAFTKKTLENYLEEEARLKASINSTHLLYEARNSPVGC